MLSDVATARHIISPVPAGPRDDQSILKISAATVAAQQQQCSMLGPLERAFLLEWAWTAAGLGQCPGRSFFDSTLDYTAAQEKFPPQINDFACRHCHHRHLFIRALTGQPNGLLKFLQPRQLGTQPSERAVAITHVMSVSLRGWACVRVAKTSGTFAEQEQKKKSQSAAAACQENARLAAPKGC